MATTEIHESKPINESQSGIVAFERKQPSTVSRHYEKVVMIEDKPIKLTLICMKKSFLLHVGTPVSKKESVMQGFTSENKSLDNLSLAVGQHCTVIMNAKSEHSTTSSKYALSMSKSINNDRPVYVSFSLGVTFDNVNAKFLKKLNFVMFNFVRDHYIIE